MAENFKGIGANDVRRLLPPQVVADTLGLSLPTLARWRCSGQGPVYVKVGGRVGYDPADIAAWVAANRRQTTARAA